MISGRLPFDDEHIPTLFKKINGGIFTIPSFLSAQAKHIISMMLIVDPVNRISIPEIRELEWFNTSLPPYLKAGANTLGDKIDLFRNTDIIREIELVNNQFAN